MAIKMDVSSLTAEDGGQLHLHFKNGESLPVETPLSLNYRVDADLYEVHFLLKKDLKESEIFQVYDARKQRIGWCIPALALSSDLHDYSENVHFLNYASAAMKNVLRAKYVNQFGVNIDLELNSLKLSDIYHSNVAILVINKNSLEVDDRFEIDRAVPSLAKYGYVKFLSEYSCEIFLTADGPSDSKLKLKKVSEDLEQLVLISQLYHQLFYCESKAEFRFFFLYQLFELLLEEVFHCEEHRVFNEIEKARTSGKIKDALAKIGSLTSEKTRMNSLFSVYTKVDSAALLSLKSACTDFLRLAELDVPNECGQCLYAVRNKFIHEYWRSPEDTSDRLNFVANETIEVLEQIFASFESPHKIDDSNQADPSRATKTPAKYHPLLTRGWSCLQDVYKNRKLFR